MDQNISQEYKIVSSTKKSQFRKPKKVPINYEEIDKWKMPQLTAQDIKGPFVEESSFATLFPKYREKYIREVFTFVQKGLREVGIKSELDLIEGSMTVRTTNKTIDPYIIIKARDVIKLLARSVPYEQCLRLLNEDIYCDILKIKSLVPRKDKFIKRRQRLIGPNGSTIKALEILTECYIMVQGHTVSIIGHYKKLKQVRRIIENIMGNIHPVFFIKELMIKKELENDPVLKNQSWDRFLPKYQKNKNIQENKKKKIKKVKKERSTFPNPPQPRKIDLQMESGEYFLGESLQKQKQKQLKKEKEKQKMKEKLEERQKQYQQPGLKQELKEKQLKQKKVESIKEENLDDIIKKFKIDVKRELIQLIMSEKFEKGINLLIEELQSKKDKNKQQQFTQEKMLELQNKVNFQIIGEMVQLGSNEFRQILIKNLKLQTTESNIISLVMLKIYLSQPKYKLQISFLEDIITYFIESVKNIKDPFLSAYSANIYEKLLKMAPKGIVTKLEKNAKTLIQDITINTNVRSSQDRITIYNLLFQLMKNEKYIVLKEIWKSGPIPLFTQILNEKGSTQEASLEFLQEFVIEVSKQDKEEQKNQFYSLYIDIIDDLIEIKNNTSVDYIKGVFSFTKYLFQYLDKSVFDENFSKIIQQIYKIAEEYIIDNLNNNFCLFLQLIPVLAKYNPKKFKEDLLKIIKKILSLLEILKIEERQVMFASFEELINLYKKVEIKEICVEIFEKVKIHMEINIHKRSFQLSEKTFDCIFAILKKISWIENLDERSLNSFVDILLIHSLNQKTVKIINFLCKSNEKNFSKLVKIKLWYTLNVILSMNEKGDQNENINLYIDKIQIQNEIEEKNYEEVQQNKVNYLQLSQPESVYRSQNPIQFYGDHNLERLLDDFKINLYESYRRDPDKFHTKDKISISLELLAKYGSEVEEKAQNNQFIKDIVLKYLESPFAELRKKAASIVFHFSSEKNPKFLKNLSLSNKIIQGIMNKLLVIAVSDSDQGVRYETLTTLNQMGKIFNQYLVTEDNLKRLMLCFHDQDSQIQNQSLLIFQKLAPYNPEIIPKIENIIFKLVSFLSLKKKNFGMEDANFILTLRIFVKKSLFFIEGKLLVLCEILLKLAQKCYEERQSSPIGGMEQEKVIREIFHCYSDIFFVNKEIAVMYFDEISKFCMMTITNEDNNLIPMAFKCITSLIQSSGFQLIFWMKYDIFNLIIDTMHKNISDQIKYQILKFLGYMGAIEPNFNKKIRQLREEQSLKKNLSNQEIEEELFQIVRKNLNFFEDLKKKGQNLEDPNMKIFKMFRRHVRIIENHSKKINNEEEVKKHYEEKNKIISANQLEEKYNNFEMMQTRISQIQIKIYNLESLLDYICEHTLTLLFELLNNNKEEDTLNKILDSFELIITYLGVHIFKFKDLVYSKLLLLFNLQISKLITKRILKILKIFVQVSKSQMLLFNHEIDQLLVILIEKIEIPMFQKNIMEILLVILNHPKDSLKHKLRDFVNQLLSILLQDPFNKNIDKIFKIIYILDFKDYIYHIMPVFARIISNCIDPTEPSHQPPRTIIQSIYVYFEKTLRCSLVNNYFSLIIRVSLKFLDKFQEKEEFSKQYYQMDEIIKQYLIKMLLVLRESCLLHLPLLHNYLKFEPKYQKILRSLKETGYFDLKFSEEVNLNNQIQFNNFQEEEPNSYIKNSLRKVNFDQLIQIFSVDKNYKHDDWEDWFNKLKVDLITNSPSNLLIACKELISFQDIIKNLFKPAFAIVWYQLNDSQKSEILKNLDSIISKPSSLPISVLKEILELVEFMSHDNLNGLNLDIKKLAYLAIKCLSFPKAIYFKEQEFELSPQECSQNLLNLYIQSQLMGSSDTILEYQGKILKPRISQGWFDSEYQSKKDFVMGLSKYEEEKGEDSIYEQIKLHNVFSKWEFTIEKIKDLTQKSIESEKEKEQIDDLIGTYGSQAAFHLSRWDLLETYNNLNKESFEKEFYKTCLLIQKEDFKKAKLSIKNLRAIFQKDGLSFGNYSGSYKKYLTLQKISELEEIIKIKKNFKEISENELYLFIKGEQKIEEQKKNMRKRLLQNWEDRLTLIQPNIRYWEETIAIRSLFCTKEELFDSLLKLSKMSLKKDRHPLYKQIFKQISQNSKNLDQNPQLKLALCEMEFQTGEKDEQGIINFANDLVSNQSISVVLKQKFFKKVAKWLLNTDNPSLNKNQVLDFVIKILHQSLLYSKNDFKVYHYFGLANYKAIKKVKDENDPKLDEYLDKAFQGFVQSISIKSNGLRSFVIQDLLRILNLWFKYGHREKVQILIDKAKQSISQKDWLLVVGQIIARIDDQNEIIKNSIKNLLISLSNEFPQTLIYPLLIAKRSNNQLRMRVAKSILFKIKENYPILLNQATIFSEELIRISVLLEEQWYNGIGEAWKYVQENKFQMMQKVLDDLHMNTRKNIKTINEIGFFQQFGSDLAKAQELMKMYFTYKNKIFLTQAWNFYADFYYILEKRFENFENIYLENVSQQLLNFKNSQLFVPGDPNQVRIKKIHSVLKILKSKRKPRKLALFGNNNKKYFFLLKGHEDLRQDERVMQFLNLVNDLLNNKFNVNFRQLNIVTLNVLPLSVNCGIISWLDNCDTLSICIKNYRETFGIFPDSERRLVEQFTNRYDTLSKLKKVEIYRFVCEHTKAEDFKKILWLRNPSAEKWILYRANYINTLAVMSMVGYILGLGDRHLSNLMIQNDTGKIVHIDFGDCFETASRREKLPEKVPFRLTRVLVNAMEAFGIEGSFKTTSENVMNLLRSNKESLIAILEEFVRDPLISWRMLVERKMVDPKEDLTSQKLTNDLKVIESLIEIKLQSSEKNHSFFVEGAVEMQIKQKKALDQNVNNNDSIAKEAINRIKKKLTGKDFDEMINKSYKEQVKELLKQATSQENISQAYSGWNPFL